ncbi:MAG: hypothetical protein P4N60_19205 [Verrucomicrobiae bacterium]|nr:hypothetical protein [Verrucomicrobiae bacterium]
MMLAEQVATNINWTLICTIIMAIATFGMWLDSRKSRTTNITPNPLEVKEAASFVHRQEFEKHVEVNSQTHRDIFSKIGGVERGANSSIESKVETVRKDLVHVSNQVSALESKTDAQNQQLARMDAKLDRLTERQQLD